MSISSDFLCIVCETAAFLMCYGEMAMYVCYAAQVKMLREQLSAEQLQFVHESSNMLVGSANHIETALRHECFPSEGMTLFACKPFYEMSVNISGVSRGNTSTFLRATAGTALARLSHRNSVCPSVTRVDQAKTVQARIIKSSPSAAPKTLVSGSVTLFKNSIGVTPIEGPK